MRGERLVPAVSATRRCNPPSTHAAMTDGASTALSQISRGGVVAARMWW
jgi:hypothetical protein